MGTPWELTGNSGTDPTTDFIGTTDNQPLFVRTNNAQALAIDPTGNVGIGTDQPNASLSIVEQGASEVIGSAQSPVFRASAGPLASAAGSETAIASLGVVDGGNHISLGVRLIRTASGSGWPTTALGLGMDVDNTVRAGASLFLNATGIGIGTNTPATALHVVGTATVTGDVLLTGADCAEDFDVASTEPPDPGTVVVINDGGAVTESRAAYDCKVAGVVSGAGDYRHGVLLDRQPDREGRVPVALVGKVFCKVDAEYSAIEVGDLLTTSATPGHAMKAVDSSKSAGALIGKALRPLKVGRGLIPILITLG